MFDSVRTLTAFAVSAAAFLLTGILIGIGVPWWVADVAFLAVTVGTLYMLYRPDEVWQERWAKGLCVRCGYDLRETPQKCPECGTVPSSDDAPPAQ